MGYGLFIIAYRLLVGFKLPVSSRPPLIIERYIGGYSATYSAEIDFVRTPVYVYIYIREVGYICMRTREPVEKGCSSSERASSAPALFYGPFLWTLEYRADYTLGAVPLLLLLLLRESAERRGPIKFEPLRSIEREKEGEINVDKEQARWFFRE